MRVRAYNALMRWPSFLRFSLRALLIAVTLVCCWLAWEMSIVRHRQQVRQRTQERFTFASTREVVAAEIPDDTPGVARISFVRRWMGDVAIQQIYYLNYGTDKAEFEKQLAELERVFPEAEIINIGPHEW